MLTGGQGQGAGLLGRFDQFLAQNLAHFLQRLKDTTAGEDGSNLLDRTLVLYGSSNSHHDEPLLLAGGHQAWAQGHHYLNTARMPP